MDELIAVATNDQLKAALKKCFEVIEALSATTGAYVREDVVEKIKEAHMESIADCLRSV